MDTANKEKYDHYLKEVRISQDMLETAESKGKIAGKIEGKIEVILALNDDKIPTSQIAKYVQLPEEDVIHILSIHYKM